jgi:hypothetical protein
MNGKPWVVKYATIARLVLPTNCITLLTIVTFRFNSFTLRSGLVQKLGQTAADEVFRNHW